MEQNRVVAMLDEEIDRLRQVRTIMQSLIAEELETASLLDAVAGQSAPEQDKMLQEDRKQPEAALSTVVRHVSRRGISTGRRGPRTSKHATPSAPRPLDHAVPKAPVVVSRSALVTKPAAVVAPPSAEDSLEAWARQFRQTSSAASAA